MARIRVPVVFGIGALTAAAPTFSVVPGSFLPVVPGKSDANGVLLGAGIGDVALAGGSYLVEVPDEDVTGNALDPAKLKARYAGHWLIVNHVISGT